MPLLVGSVMVSAMAVARAASTALPPGGENVATGSGGEALGWWRRQRDRQREFQCAERSSVSRLSQASSFGVRATPMPGSDVRISLK